MKKVFEINKTINYDDESFDIIYQGYKDKVDFNIESEIDKFMTNYNRFDVLKIVTFLRTLLKDYNETLLDIYYKKGNMLEQVTYSEQELIYIKKIGYQYEFEYSLFNNTFTYNKKNEKCPNVNNSYEIVDYIERLKNASEITLNRESKVLIGIYKLFYGKNPDFSQNDINVKVQTMLCILSYFGIYLTDYNFNISENSKMPLSIQIEDMVKMLYPLGEIKDVESPIVFSEYTTKVIKTIGKSIRDSISEYDENDKLISISRAIYSTTCIRSKQQKEAYMGETEEESINNIRLIKKLNNEINKSFTTNKD